MPEFIVETFGYQESHEARDIRDLRRVLLSKYPQLKEEGVAETWCGPKNVIYAPNGYIYSLEDILFPMGGFIRPIDHTSITIHLPEPGSEEDVEITHWPMPAEEN